MSIHRLTSVCILWFASALPVLADGSLTGSVLDSSGASVPAARIVIERGLNRWEAASESNGQFSIPRIEPGRARVTVSRSGFSHQQTIEIRDGESTELRVRLEAAPISESVTVVAGGDA